MSLMAGQLFADNPVVAYAILALGIQLTVFCSVSLRALFRNKAGIEACARLPLDDEEAVHE